MKETNKKLFDSINESSDEGNKQTTVRLRVVKTEKKKLYD